jgi:hypothetical protein
MKKYILGFGLPLTALALMSFTSSSSNHEVTALAAGDIKITCPSGDDYTCYEGGGITVYKGDGDVTISFE